MTKITAAQIRVIQVARRQLDLPEEAYRAMLAEYGVASSTALSSKQAGLVIDNLKRLGFALQAKPRRQQYRRRTVGRSMGNVVVMASQRELDKIAVLARLVEWRVENGYQAWLEKRMGVKRVKTADESFRVIEGLKKMFEGQQRRAHGERWWCMAWEDPDIVNYIREHCPERYRTRSGLVIMDGNRKVGA